jgi:hypothetical protein
MAEGRIGAASQSYGGLSMYRKNEDPQAGHCDVGEDDDSMDGGRLRYDEALNSRQEMAFDNLRYG